MKIDRTTFFALVTTLAGGGACSSSSPSGTVQTNDAGADGGSSSSGGDSGAGVDSGSSLCGVSPCVEGAICVTDPATGNKACAQVCTTSSACPTANGCCTVVPGVTGSGACEPAGSWTGQECLCTTGTECSAAGHAGSTSSCCAPVADANGNPTGPLICKPNDGKAYDCAATTSATECPAGFCVSSNSGNGAICMEPCTSQSQCADGATCQALSSGTCNTSPKVCWISPTAE